MSEVIEFDGWTTLDIPIERLRDNIKWDKCDTALVLTWQDGKVVPYCNRADLEHCVFLASQFIHNALNGEYDT